MIRNVVKVLILFVSCLGSSFLLVSGLTCRSSSVEQVKQWTLNVAMFVPLPDKDYDPAFDQGYSIIPAVELAADQINKRTDILPLRHLNVIVQDSGCDKSPKTAIETLRVLRDLRETQNGPTSIIGPACSEDSIFIANTFHRIFSLPILYSGTTPRLSESAGDTPNAFGIISSTTVLIDALIRIATKENWNWEDIAVLYDESTERYQDTYDTFIRGLNNSQLPSYTRQITSSQIPLAEVIDRNIRIVVVISGKRPARQLACIAGQPTVKFAFPIQQLIFVERSLDDFLGEEFSFTELGENKDYHCDEETLIRGLNGSVFLNQALDSVDPDTVTESNYTAGQVKQQYRERLLECGKLTNMNLSETTHAYAYYDAMWALAQGMHLGIYSPNPSFDAINEAILNNVSFQGASDWISFSDDHHVANAVNIEQLNDSSLLVRGVSNGSYLVYTNDTFIDDEFTEVNEILHPALIAFGCLSCALSFLFTVILQVTNTHFRDYPTVKASSPRLSHFIFIGCYLLLIALIISTLRHVWPNLSGAVLCNLDIVCALLGYCLIFSTILAKSWRTYRIFNHPFESQRFLHDSTLTIIIAFLLIVEVLLLTINLAVSPFKASVSATFVPSQWPPVKRLTTICVANPVGYIALPLVFQVLLTLGNIFLATLNRNVTHKNFRTTRQIIVLVYILAITWLLGGPLLAVFYFLDSSVHLTYLIYSILLSTTVILCLSVLILPAVLLAADTKWKRSFSARTHRGSWLIRRSFRESNTDATFVK